MAASELGARLSRWQENAVGRSICNFLPFCDIWLIERLDHESGPHRVSSCSRRRSTEIHHGSGSTWAGITAEIRGVSPTLNSATASSHAATTGNVLTQQVRILNLFCKQVLTNPVNNRKLSGGFLLVSRLRATVDCKKLWDGIIKNYKFSTNL